MTDDTTDTMSENTDAPDTIVTPGTLDTESDDETDSPAEKMRSTIEEKFHRDFTAASDDHPLAVTAGSKEALRSDTPVQVQEILSEGLYESPDAFMREWKQNHIAAIVREAKRRIIEEYGEDLLFYTIEHDHEELDGPRQIRLPKSSEDVLDTARELGFIPTIEFVVDHDEQKLTTRDNGIGMTTGEVIEVWNEPAVSGSGVDLSSAGNKGIGSLTWVTIAGKEGAMVGQTRTRRMETLSGKTVPQRDRDGFNFVSYFGGVLPVDGPVPDGFYGTKFEIPVRDDIDTHQFFGWMEDYTDVLPVQIDWHEIEDGVRDEEEFERTTFWDRYDEEPSIQIDRPGEFRIALDTPAIVKKGGRHNDTFLLDNPIDRNASYNQSFDTLWNEHIQILNEQGLIVAGPHRGMLASEVDELHGDVHDIEDPDAPMPDVPLPEPVSSRDTLKNDEALDRFLTYANHLATQEEIDRVAEYVNGYLDADDVNEALEFIRERGTEYELFTKLVSNHKRSTILKHADRLYEWFDERDEIDFDGDDCDHRTDADGNVVTNDNDEPLDDYTTHEKWDHIDLLAKMRESVDYATKSTYGDPNKKSNRSSDTLGHVLTQAKCWPIFAGGTINQDRARVITNTYPDAAMLKIKSYGKFQGEPFNATKVKNVPFKRDAEGADAWDIPDSIHEKRTTQSAARSSSGDGDGDGDDGPGKPEDFEDRPVDVRHTENAAIDTRTNIGDIMSGIADTDWGDTLVTDDDSRSGGTPLSHPWMVVFPSTEDENISDHWWLSQYAAIVKANRSESDALLQYPQVFTLDDFEAMLADTLIDTYDPFSETGSSATIADLMDHDKRVVWFDKDSHRAQRLLAALKHDDAEYLPDPSDDRYEYARSAVVEKFCAKFDWDNPDEVDDGDWTIALFPERDSTTHERLRRYLNGFYEMDDPEDYQMFFGDTHSLGMNGLTERRPTWMRKTAERGAYPEWSNDSDAWERLNESGGGYHSNPPNGHEKEMYRAVRDAGIDPYDHDAERFGRLLRELLPEGDN